MYNEKAGIGRILIQLVLIILLIISVVPLYLTLINVFKPNEAIIRAPFALPINFTFENLEIVFSSKTVSMWQAYLNTALLTLFGTGGTIIVSSLASYYIARTVRKRFGRFMNMYFLLAMMIPYIIVYVPLCIILRMLSLITAGVPVLIFIYISSNIPFGVFMYVSFIKSLPPELEEAAMIDGAGSFQTFWRILFPLLKPCTATVAIFVGASIWNDFLTPLLIGNVRTITTGIYTAIGEHSTNFGMMFAYVFIATLPIIIMYLAAQKNFISGLTSGALKG